MRQSRSRSLHQAPASVSCFRRFVHVGGREAAKEFGDSARHEEVDRDVSLSCNRLKLFAKGGR